MILTIKITAEVLKRSMLCGTEKAEDGITTSCAVALALKDVFGKVSVSGKYIIFCDTYQCIETPIAAFSFIQEFDLLRETPELRPFMQPFSFQITLPDSVIEAIYIGDMEKSETVELTEL